MKRRRQSWDSTEHPHSRGIGIATKSSLWKHHANVIFRVQGLSNPHFPKVLEQWQLLLIPSSKLSSSSENGDASARAWSARSCSRRQFSSQACHRLLTWQEAWELFHSCESLLFTCSSNNVPARPVPCGSLSWAGCSQRDRSAPLPHSPSWDPSLLQLIFTQLQQI